LADHPAHFAVVGYPGTEKFGPGIQDEITLYLLVYILKFVVVGPDIITGAADDVLASFGEVSSRSGFNVCTDIIMTVKNTDGLGKHG